MSMGPIEILFYGGNDENHLIACFDRFRGLVGKADKVKGAT